jgi:DNA-binding response OmpR family regulator
MRLLIVEDDHAVRELVARGLEEQGVSVTKVARLAAGLLEVRQAEFDVVVLDLTLPDGTGLDLLQALRKLESPSHVIILSGAGGEVDRVRALKLGADDYVVKPFFVRELTARILAVQRRQASAHDRRLQYGPISIDLVARQVTVDDAPIPLAGKEFDLLAFLAARPRQAFSRAELLRSVWQSAADWQQGSTVTEHVRRLRSKIEQAPHAPRILMTVRGVGYRFDPPADAHQRANCATPRVPRRCVMRHYP